MSRKLSERERFARSRTAGIFGYVEDVFYSTIALALAVAGALLFGYHVYSFVTGVQEVGMAKSVLEFLDGLLLVFIITELLHTVRAIVAEGVIVTEPFLIVGIVAAIRRIIVISAEAKDMVGTDQFGDAMTEVGVLAAAVLVLGVTIFLLRRTESMEPASDPGKH